MKSTPKSLLLNSVSHQDSMEEEKDLLKININYGECTNCQTCVSTCPMAVYEMENDKVIPSQEDQCIVCRACEVACPVEAIIIEE